jgi:hypothetical protein
VTVPGAGTFHAAGTRWTAWTNGVPCSTVMSTGKILLQRYPAARKTLTHEIKGVLAGYFCSAENVGEANCYDNKHSRNLEIYETGSYTIPQLKAMGLGR